MAHSQPGGGKFHETRDSIPGILWKGIQTEAERKAVTVSYISGSYSSEDWTHIYIYTDGSAEGETRNGGGGIFIRLNDGRTIHHAILCPDITFMVDWVLKINYLSIYHAILTGKYSTNDKAEAEALRTAASTLMDNVEAIHTKVVIFSGALFMIQALPNPRNKELNDLVTALHSLQQSTQKTAIQWIPSHCNIPGNKVADRLAKEGGKLPQGRKISQLYMMRQKP